MRDTAVWTDPWLIRKAFNNSWTLLPAPDFDLSLLHDVSFIWLSHEHPDHLNFPTLASLPAEFKSRMTILFQQNNPERIFEPLRKVGYRNFTSCPIGASSPSPTRLASIALGKGPSIHAWE